MHCSVPHTGQVRYLLQEPGPPQRQVPADFGLRLLQLIECYYLILYIYMQLARNFYREYMQHNEKTKGYLVACM